MYKLSVIILNDKVNKNRLKTLESLMQQTLKDIEVIYVSKIIEDEEKEIKEYIDKYENIKIQRDINEAISNVSGEYTVIANSSVFFEKAWAQRVYDYAKIDNEDLIICDLDIEDYQENLIKEYSFENIEKSKSRMVILNWNLCNLLFKTEKIKNIKLKTNNKYNELFFILEALTECNKIGYAQEVKCYQYMRKSDLKDIELKDIDELKDALKEVKEIYKSKNKYDKRAKNILSAIAFSKLGVEALVKINDKSELDVNMKELVKSIINYLDINFFEWRNNPILKSAFMKKENSSIWYAHKMYRYGYIELFLKLDRFINRK